MTGPLLGLEMKLELLLEPLNMFRELETQLKFFNLAFANLLWLTKLIFMLVNILGMFAAIRIAQRNPVLAALYSLLSVDCAIGYIAVFQLAYRVTDKAEELRRLIELTSAQLSVHNRNYCERWLRSIPTMAMRVGGFHTVERESVP